MNDTTPRTRSYPYTIRPAPSEHWAARALRAIWRWL